MDNDKVINAINNEITMLDYLVYNSLEDADDKGDMTHGQAYRQVCRMMRQSYKRILKDLNT